MDLPIQIIKIKTSAVNRCQSAVKLDFQKLLNLTTPKPETRKRSRPPDLSPDPPDQRTKRQQMNLTDSFDASKELETSRNNSTIIHQPVDRDMTAILAELPYNQTVFNKFSLVRRSSTPFNN